MRALFFALPLWLTLAQPADNTSPPIIVLAIGQSNMEGRYGSADAVYDEASDAVWAWNNQRNIWSTQAQLGLAPFFPAKGLAGAVAGNLAYTFAHRLAEYCGTTVRLVVLAAGGMRVEYFLKESTLVENGWNNGQDSAAFGSSISDEIFSSDGIATRALEAGDAGKFDLLLFHQGEANSVEITEGANDYYLKASALFHDLRNDGLLAKDAPVVVGKINPNYRGASNHGEAIDMLAAHELIGAAEWDGIETFGDGNNHATGNGLVQLGHRYFEVLMSKAPGICD